MKLSKHYYAIELAKRNNEVYFLIPSKKGINPKVEIIPSTEHSNLCFVHFSILAPYFLKFKWPSLFQRVMDLQGALIRKAIGKPIDIVWDFDCNFLFHRLNAFQSKLNIFHPVDQGGPASVSKRPDIIFSVSDVILDSQKHLEVPRYFVNHGLGPQFVELARKKLKRLTKDIGKKVKHPQNVGYIGNLKHPAIDKEILLEIIQSHPELHFHFFGPYELYPQDENNISLKNFINYLIKADNVSLYGLQNQDQIIEHNKIIDLYLATYKKTKHYNADNSHKILEYLSTGKIVVSNLLSAYEGSELFIMPKDFSNQTLPDLFDEALEKWPELHTPKKRKSRIQFALDHSYEEQLKKIEQKLVDHQLI